MDRLPLRSILTAAAAVLAAALLTAAQIALAEWCGLIRLAPFAGGGDDRTGGSSLAVVGWFTAISAALGVLLARRLPLPARLVTAALATGTSAEAALLLAGLYADHDGLPIMVGAALGLGVAVLTAWLPAAGLGVGLHAGALWLTAAAGGVLGHAVMLVGFTMDSIIEPGPLTWWGYLPNNGVVTICALLAFAVVVPVAVHHATGRVGDALAASFTGPLLALALYPPLPEYLVQWHGYAFELLLQLTPALLALSGLATAASGLWRRAASR